MKSSFSFALGILLGDILMATLATLAFALIPPPSLYIPI